MKIIDTIRQNKYDSSAINREEKEGAKIYTISKGAGFYDGIYQRIIICKAKDIQKHI